jgi:hypothetical protein
MQRLAILSIGLMANLALMAAPSASADAIPTHRYAFEQNLNDSVDSLNGSSLTTASYAADSKTGSYSILTDAGGGYVDFPTLDLGNQFSIALWLKPSPDNPSDIQTILANSDGGYPTSGIRLYYNTWGNTDHALVLETGNANITTAGGAVTIGEWNQIVVTVDKTAGTGKLYCNGTLAAAGSVNSGLNTNSNWRVGAFLDNASPLHGGNVDDVQIYSGLLNAEQVAYLHDHPGVAVPEPSTPVLLLGFGVMGLWGWSWQKRR